MKINPATESFYILVFTKTLLTLHRMHYYHSFWGTSLPDPQRGLCPLYTRWVHGPQTPASPLSTNFCIRHFSRSPRPSRQYIVPRRATLGASCGHLSISQTPGAVRRGLINLAADGQPLRSALHHPLRYHSPRQRPAGTSPKCCPWLLSSVYGCR